MATYSIEEAKALLSELIDKALAGEGVTITRDGKPVAELRPTMSATVRRPSPRLINEIAARAKTRPREDAPAPRRECRRHHSADAGRARGSDSVSRYGRLARADVFSLCRRRLFRRRDADPEPAGHSRLRRRGRRGSADRSRPAAGAGQILVATRARRMAD